MLHSSIFPNKDTNKVLNQFILLEVKEDPTVGDYDLKIKKDKNMQTGGFFSGVLKVCLSFVPYISTFLAKRVQNQQKKAHTP